MTLPWPLYAAFVALFATGVHFFARLAKGTIDPTVAVSYSMFFALVVSLFFLPAAKDEVIKSFTETKGIILYALVGTSIAFAQLGIYWMFQAGAPISIATPLVRFAPAVFAVLIGVLFFHEVLKIHHVIGLLFAALGFYLMTQR